MLDGGQGRGASSGGNEAAHVHQVGVGSCFVAGKRGASRMGSGRVCGEGWVERIARVGHVGSDMEGNMPGSLCLYECITFPIISFSG
jgi:hypothetical protein